MVLALVEQRAGLIDRAGDRVAHDQRLLLDLDLAAGDAGDVEEVVDQPGQVADLALDHRALARRALAHLDQLEGGEDRGQGVPQLVAEHGEELVLAAAGRLGLAAGQPGLLVEAGVVDRQRGAPGQGLGQRDVALLVAALAGVAQADRAEASVADQQRDDEQRAQAEPSGQGVVLGRLERLRAG